MHGPIIEKSFTGDTGENQALQFHSRQIFTAEQETNFQRNREVTSAPMTRLAMVLAFLLVGGFVLLDRLVFGELLVEPAFLLLAGFLCPLLGVFAVLGYLPSATRHLRILILINMTISGLCYLAIMVLMHGASAVPVMPYGYEAFILFTLFAYFFSGLRYLWATLLAIGASLAFIGSQIWVGLNTSSLLYTGFFLFGTSAVGVIGKYLLDSAGRREFIARETLNYLAEHDPLTGLLNRRAMGAQMEKLWAQAARDSRSIGIMLVDVDEFKGINDKKGHKFGDNCLKTLARLLEQHTRRPWDIAARYGGDEFVVLWYDISKAHLHERVNTMLLQTRNSGAGITISIGAAYCVPGPGRSVDSLLREADKHLYRAKRAGRDQAAVYDGDSQAIA